MKKLRNMLVAVIAMVGLTTSAQSFEGWGVGGTLSFVDFSTSGSETANANGAQETGASSADKASTSVSKDVDIGSFFLEYTLPQGSTFGLEYVPGEGELGAKSRTDTASDSNEATDDSGTYTAKAQISDHVMLYAEPTMMLSETFGVYLKGGFAKVTVESLESGQSSSTYGNQDVYGVAQGVGAKLMTGNWYWKLDYLETEYGEVSLDNSNGEYTVTAEPESDMTKLSLGYKF